MRRFTISGSFEADDIDDAFLRLASHFAVIGLNLDPHPDYPFPGEHTFTVEPEAVPPTGRAEPS
jgi:hypothetical protein